MRKRLQQGARGTGAVHLLHIFIREDCSFPAQRGERCSPNTDGEALPPHPSAPAGLFHEVPQTGPLAACRAISQVPSFLRTNADTSKPLQTAVLGFLSISSVQKEENMVEEIALNYFSSKHPFGGQGPTPGTKARPAEARPPQQCRRE